MYLQLKIDFHEFIFERKEKSFSFHCFVVYERNAIMWFGDDNTPTPIEQNFIQMQWRRSCCNLSSTKFIFRVWRWWVSEWMRMGETMKVNFVPSSVLLCLSSFVLIDYYSGPYWHALGHWVARWVWGIYSYFVIKRCRETRVIGSCCQHSRSSVRPIWIE